MIEYRAKPMTWALVAGIEHGPNERKGGSTGPPILAARKRE